MRRSAPGALAAALAIPFGLAAASSSLSAQPHDNQDDAQLARRAIMNLVESGDWISARDPIDHFVAAHPQDAVMLYNAACVHARLEEHALAERMLLAAVKAGFLDFSAMQRDPDLRTIRDGPVYRAILSARRVADDTLAERRVAEWMRRLGSDFDSRHVFDAARRLDYITSLSGSEFDALRPRIESLADHLVQTLFGEGLRERVVVILANGTESVLLIDARTPGRYRHVHRELVVAEFDRALPHELVHMFHHAHMDRLGQQHPMWIQEGLASLYEAHELQADGSIRFTPNDRDEIARELVERGRELPWAELFALSDASFMANPAEHYALARSIFEFLAERNELNRWYRTYSAGFENDSTGIAAFEMVFNLDAALVEDQWKRWLTNRAQPAQESESPRDRRIIVRVNGHASGDSTDDTDAPAKEEVEPHRAAVEAIFNSAHPRMLSDYPRSIPLLEEVVRLAPHHADAHYDLGLAYVLTGDPAAAEREHEILLRLDRNLAALLRCVLPADE